jgi:nitroreductase
MTKRDMRKVGVYQAIYGRRMAWEFEDSPVSTSAIERMLDAAVWAPNHRLTEPWRFFVLQKDSPERLQAAELARETVLERSGDSRRAEAASQMVLDPPYVVYVYCVPGDNEDQTRENYAAVCCAVQNMALAGVAEGLSVTWETGGVTRAPGLKPLLGADEEWALATMLSIGVPGERTSSRRTPASQFARWFKRE